MNPQIHHVIGDITGMAGLAIIDAILKGHPVISSIQFRITGSVGVDIEFTWDCAKAERNLEKHRVTFKRAIL